MTLTEQAVKLLRDGMRQIDVRKETGLSKGYVSKLQEKVLGYAEARVVPKKWAGKKLRSLRRLKDAGFSVREIADLMGETELAVNMASFRYGVSKARPKSKAERELLKRAKARLKQEMAREARRKHVRRLRLVPQGDVGAGKG